MKRYRPSRDLQAILGEGVWTQAEISQRMSRYLAAHKLVNPERPGEIRPDAALAKVLGTSDPVEASGLRDRLLPHLTRINDSMPPSAAPKVAALAERKPDAQAPPITAAEFVQHVHDPSPGFICFSAGDSDTTAAWATSVRNEAGPPGTARSIAALELVLGTRPDSLADLIARHDGLTLYRDIRSESAGLVFAPVSRWSSLTAEVRASFAEKGVRSEDDPASPLSGVAFATIPGSPDALFFQTKGPLAGSIRLATLDGWEDRPLAASFGSLLGMIRSDPAAFLFRLGCVCRYTRQPEGSKWVPAKYYGDIRPHLAREH
jgi:hypothetical protein